MAPLADWSWAQWWLRRWYRCAGRLCFWQRLGRGDEANLALEQADRTFRTAAVERPGDAGAWNGLGSVAALRGQLKQALRDVDKALKLVPAYPAALEDRQQLLTALGRT